MKFAVFILSHKRADRVETFATLKNAGYTGKIYVVVDNQDPMLEKYQERFGDDVLVFDKQIYIDKTDTLETDRKRSSAVYARNFIEDAAKKFNLDVFGMFDDDVLNLRYRWIECGKIRSMKVYQGLDDILNYYIEYMLRSNFQAISFGNVMTFVGGIDGLESRLSKERLTFQIHIRNTKYPLEWKSIINNDSITELQSIKLGNIWLSIPWIVYDSPVMNTLSGGMKSVYDSLSSFSRAFYATIAEPSCCLPRFRKDKFNIGRNNNSAYPMIISGRYKK